MGIELGHGGWASKARTLMHLMRRIRNMQAGRSPASEYWDDNPDLTFDEWLVEQDNGFTFKTDGTRLWAGFDDGPSDAWSVWTPGEGWETEEF